MGYFYSPNDPNIDFNQIARKYLRCNDKIIIGNKSVNYRHWRDKGILFINDLLNEQGKVYTMNELCDVYGLTTNVVEYLGIINPRLSNTSIKSRGGGLLQPSLDFRNGTRSYDVIKHCGT